MRDFNSIGKRVEGNEGNKCNYPYRLDTYGCGCSHDCSYCYAKSLLDFRGLWKPKSPAVADISKITREIKKLPSERIKAIKKLQEAGFDVQLRLSPFIPQYVDFDILNNLGIDKICIEFLRANSWIEKWFDIDYSEYTVKENGYRHLPLEKKKEYIKLITGFKQMTVCEDESGAYEYWKEHFNHNPDDCCNLRR